MIVSHDWATTMDDDLQVGGTSKQIKHLWTTSVRSSGVIPSSAWLLLNKEYQANAWFSEWTGACSCEQIRKVFSVVSGTQVPILIRPRKVMLEIDRNGTVEKLNNWEVLPTQTENLFWHVGNRQLGSWDAASHAKCACVGKTFGTFPFLSPKTGNYSLTSEQFSKILPGWNHAHTPGIPTIQIISINIRIRISWARCVFRVPTWSKHMDQFGRNLSRGESSSLLMKGKYCEAVQFWPRIRPWENGGSMEKWKRWQSQV